MDQPDVMRLASLGPFILRARDCLAAMLSNARYILQELPTVPMDDLLRQRTRTACALLIGAGHDLIKELFDNCIWSTSRFQSAVRRAVHQRVYRHVSRHFRRGLAPDLDEHVH